LQENDWFWNKGRRQPSGSLKVEESKETSRTFQRRRIPTADLAGGIQVQNAIGGNGSLESVRFTTTCGDRKGAGVEDQTP
jgi:hypothetical protein